MRIETFQDWVYGGCDDSNEVQEFILKQKGKIFIDIGACMGFYTLNLSPSFEQVFSFEPGS